MNRANALIVLNLAGSHAQHTGVRIKARKGAVKAQAKHEPTAFRDALLKHIAGAPPGDWDALYERLVQAGVTLELLKYADELFYVLIIGGLLQVRVVVMCGCFF